MRPACSPLAVAIEARQRRDNRVLNSYQQETAYLKLLQHERLEQ
jgi:hypothetical protein